MRNIKFIVLLLVLISNKLLFAQDIDIFLLASTKNNNMNSVKQAISKGANINAQDNHGQTPVLIAVWLNNVDMVKLFLEQGANPNIKDYQKDNAFLVAGANGNVEILKLLFDNSKVAIDIMQTNRYGGNALIPSCEKGYVDSVQFLIEKKLDINHVNNLGWTCLLEVVTLGNDRQQYQEIVDILIKNKANLDIKDKQGKTALMIAKERGLKKIEALLERASLKGS